MKHRRRILSFVIALCVCTVFGVITNYAVAWWGFLRFGISQEYQFVDLPKQWLKPAPAHWPTTPTVAFDQIYGWASVSHSGDFVTMSDSYVSTSMYLTSSGWPFRCIERFFQNRTVIYNKQPPKPSTQEEFEEGVLQVSLAWQQTIGAKVLPGKIRPREFALNTAFYTAVFATLWFTPLALTRLIRRRKGRCPICNYNRAGLAATTPCPECGTTPAPR